MSFLPKLLHSLGAVVKVIDGTAHVVDAITGNPLLAMGVSLIPGAGAAFTLAHVASHKIVTIEAEHLAQLNATGTGMTPLERQQAAARSIVDWLAPANDILAAIAGKVIEPDTDKLNGYIDAQVLAFNSGKVEDLIAALQALLAMKGTMKLVSATADAPKVTP